MKIAMNITREPLAGITSTTLSLLDCLHGSSNSSFAGIELNAFRTFKSPVIYRHLSPEWFSHHVVSICDFPINKIIRKSRTLKEVEQSFRPIIETVREFIRKERPDVFLIQGTYYVPWVISIAAKEAGIPVVLWYAGVLTKEVEHMTPHFKKIFLEMERSIVRRASKIIFPSKVCKEIVYEKISKLRTVKNGSVIPNPIAPMFTRTTKIELPVQNRIAFIGRHTPIKNVQEFCSIHKRLLKEGWDHTATLVSDINKRDLKKIPKSIKVVSSMSLSELGTFYSSQGLIISPSHFETFGNVPIEAACVGIPVLVSQNMGCAEVLKASGLERMVIDFSDKDLVVSRIIELCGQHILPRQINNLKKRVDTKYVANEIMSVIKCQQKRESKK